MSGSAWLMAMAPALAQDAPVLARFPDAGGGKIVFVARDRLWTVGHDGGRAILIWAGSGRALEPRISPDGRSVAFTHVSGSSADVEILPLGGGAPRRLTFTATAGLSRGAPDNLVVGWTPDSRNVVFLSRRQSWNGWTERPFEVAASGGLPTPLPLDRSGFLSVSPDGRRLALSRELRDFAPWKRHNTGPTEGLYTLNTADGAFRQVTPGGATDTAPMWVGDRIYFLSDRDGRRRANIWVLDREGAAPREVTHFADSDVAFPAYGDGAITFEEGGRLWRLDLPSETLSPVAVSLPNDGSEPRPHEVDAAKFLRVSQGSQYPGILERPDFALSPSGDRTAFSARGDIWIIDAAGQARDLTSTSGADEDHPAFSPDGRWVAYTTDGSGEQELAVRPATGGDERRLTHFARGYLYTPVWSPDGRRLAVGDANHRLWLVSVDGGDARLVAADPNQEIRDPAFSPDGQWLAYTTHTAGGLGAIHLYDVARLTDHLVSSPMEDDFNPAFSDDGRLLVFLSNRGGVQAISYPGLDVARVRPTGIYAAVLDPRAPTPFDASGRLRNQGGLNRAVEPRGLMDRIVRLPVSASDMGAMVVRGERVFYETLPLTTLDGPAPGSPATLRVLDLTSGRDLALSTGADAFYVSGDGRRTLEHAGGKWRLRLADDGGASDFALPAMHMRIDPRAEWREMFDNAWRLERDMFADPHLDGVDWTHVHDVYAALLPRLGSRDDLSALLTSMLGELGSSHVRVAGGDLGPAPRTQEAALLGADFTLNPVTGRYRFAHVYVGDDSRPDERGPLAAPGLDVRTGDTLLAVDGRPLRAPDTPFSALLGKTGRVTLTIVGDDGRSREVGVDTLADESALRQHDWIEHNRETVDRETGGRIGYVYLADMGEQGAEQFDRQFYPQLGKDGLILDVRYNRGGYLSPMLIDHLTRRAGEDFVNREGGREPLMRAALDGSQALLINEDSVSDGENFPYLFKKLRLGAIVGARTMGGVRGVAGGWRLLDGGSVSVPFSSLQDAEGRVLLENQGVEPTLPVETSPSALLAGEDAQLLAAIRAADPGRAARRGPAEP
jgi:tricorn protease